MTKCNLFDMNNLAVRCYFSKDIEADSPHPNIQLWKYFVIDSVYNSLFKDKTTEIVLAVDDRRSWRKNVFPRYKEGRKGKREVSKVDWNIFYTEYDSLLEEIRNNLPFKVIHVTEAEADDIIGVIALYGTKDKYTVVSNDEDYLQLSSSKVKIYNPMKMTYVECQDTEKFIIEKSLLGQKKDDIFNIKTPVDWPIDKRKPGFGDAALAKVMEYGWEKWLKDNKLEDRYELNRTLIDFKRIPVYLRTGILNCYDSYVLPDPSNCYGFFKSNNFRGYLENFHNVENNLLKMY